MSAVLSSEARGSERPETVLIFGNTILVQPISAISNGVWIRPLPQLSGRSHGRAVLPMRW